MSEHGVTPGEGRGGPALSFASVADAYDRARPSYPADSVAWLVGSGSPAVVELGAGTGKLTELLVAGGHDVLATDPLPEMLALLQQRVPDARTAVATAERIPLPSRSVDLVVCAQSFHWFDHDTAMPEIARVLKPGGVLALVWNTRDEGIPWVRKLGRLMGNADAHDLCEDLSGPLEASEHFGPVDGAEFRFWQTLRKPELVDLARSRSYVASLNTHQREDVLARVGALYDDYGRGPDGMQLPYVTRCFRAVVDHQAQPPVVLSPVTTQTPGTRVDGAVLTDPDATQAIARPAAPPEDPGTLLIDFS